MSKPRSSNKNMLFLIFIMVVNALAYGTIIPLMYPFASRFGIGPAGLGFLFASFSMAQFLSTPIIGRLSDKYGRKPLLIFSLFGTSLSLALFGLAWSVPILFIARILDGITGGNISVAQAAIADVTKPEDRTKTFGMLGAAFGFGFAFGPAIGGILSQFGLAIPFLFAAGLGFVGTLVGWFLFEETNTHRETKPAHGKLIDLPGMVQALFSPVVGAVFMVSLISLTGLNAMFIGFQSYSVDVIKLSATHVGLIFTVFGVIQVIMQGFGIRFIMQKIPSKRALVQWSLFTSGIVIAAISFGWSVWPFSILMWLFGILNSPMNAVLGALISERAKPEDQGGMMGLSQSFASLAQIIGPLVAGAIVGWSIQAIFLMAGVASLISVVVARKIPAPERGQVDL